MNTTRTISTVSILMIVVLVICTCFFMTACAQHDATTSSVQDPSIGVGEQTSGGSSKQRNQVNLANIGIEMQGNDTVLRMSFIKGSRVAGTAESIISQVPEYTVTLLPEPCRLKVDLAVDYADYADESELFSDSLAYGVFKTRAENSSQISIYFQLKQGVVAEIAEDDSVLKITLSPQKIVPRDAFFVGLDAFDAYQKGEIDLSDEEISLTPTMGDNLTDLLLISKAYYKEDEARAHSNLINQKLSDIKGIGISSYVFSMKTSDLPAIETTDMSALTGGKPIITKEDEQATPMPVLIENGEYLCTMPTGDIVFYRQAFMEDLYDTDQPMQYELWQQNKKGSQKRLPLPILTGIEQAEVSHSGTYLGVIQSSLTSRVLHVFNFETEEWQNLGEEGFGDDTSSFVWDTTEDIIYAMTGYGTLQLTKYDYSEAPENRISSVEEKNGAESRIQLKNGYIYFADQNQGTYGEVYSVNLYDASRKTLGEGIEFALSPSGKYMLARTKAVGKDIGGGSNLNLINLYSGEETRIVKDLMIEEFSFGADDHTIYYTAQNDEGTKKEYPYTFIKFLLQTKEAEFLGYSKTGNFTLSEDRDKIYIIDYTEEEDYNYPVTYTYTEDKWK